jgi:hypothetical protein
LLTHELHEFQANGAPHLVDGHVGVALLAVGEDVGKVSIFKVALFAIEPGVEVILPQVVHVVCQLGELGAAKDALRTHRVFVTGNGMTAKNE